MLKNKFITMNQSFEILVKEKLFKLKVIKAIAEIAEKQNIKVYAVGGFVRDLILDQRKK